jgi:DNA polymerase-3 subunit epsilon
MGRCLSPCLGDLDPNLYRSRVDAALRPFRRRDPRRALLAHVDGLMREASAERRYERAAWLKRRRERLEHLLRRAGPGLALTAARPLLVLADSPGGEDWEAFWLVGGRVADWGPLPPPAQIAERTAAALRGAGAPLRPHEIAQARVAGAWIASNEPYSLDLSPSPDAARIARFLERAGARCAAPGDHAGRPGGQGDWLPPAPAPAPAAELISSDASYTSDSGGALTLTGVP